MPTRSLQGNDLRIQKWRFAFAGIGVPLFNLAFPKSSSSLRRQDLERLIGEFGKILTQRGVPGFLFVRNGQGEEGAGVEPLLRMPGMVAEEIARLNVVSHEMEVKDVKQLTCAALWQAPHHGFSLYEDGLTVAGSAASFVEGVSYLGWMATPAAYRGRGYAEALLRHMDAFMRRRYSVKGTVLHATEMGRPIYERMGLQFVDEYVAYLCLPGQ